MNAKLVSAKELAVRYSIAPKTVRKWARCAVLPVIRFNCRCIRFDVDKCDEVINRRTRISGSATVITLCTTTVLSGMLLPILIAFLATEWQQNSHERESNPFVNGQSTPKTGWILGAFFALNHSVFKALTQLANACALAPEVA